MSVINRMLTDLERRGAPGARRQRGADGPARTGSPRRALGVLRRLGPPVLLVALLIVGAALWREQWPSVLALVESTRESPAAEETVTEDQASGEPSLPDVRRFEFERDGATTRLVVVFDRPLEEAPGYGRGGDRIGLQLPARWTRDELPAPPSDQSVYRSAVVDERGDGGTRIGMRVDPEARFDLSIDGDRLTLTGRAPSADGGDDDADRAASDGADVDVGAGIATLADTGAAGANGTEDSGDTSATTPGDTTNATGASGQSEPAEDEEGDTDAQAAAGQDAAEADPGIDATAADDVITTAVADDDGESGQAEERSDEADGQVRKSEPDIAPEERARRLEAKARETLDDGDVAAARDRLERALEFDADRHSARDLLVGLSLRSGDSATARNLLADGVARAPERAAYAKPFARLLVDAGDLERALRVLRRAAPAADRDAGYHGLTAAVAQRLKRHELAASEYTRALEIDSSRGVWWMGLGISLRATDHPDEALAAFREARASGDLNERLDRWVQQRIDALSRTVE